MLEYAEGTEGVTLADLVTEHWRVRAGTCETLAEVVEACREAGVGVEGVHAVAEAINARRGYPADEDVLRTAFVPAERVDEVKALLDRIADLCMAL